MLSTEYRGYEIQACTHGGYAIYYAGKHTQVNVDSKTEATRIIDYWKKQEDYEGYCDSAASSRLGD